MPTDPHAHLAVFLVALSIHLTLHSPPFLSSFPPFTRPFPGLPKHSTLPPLPHYPWRAPIPSHMSTNANIYHFSKHFRQQLWTTEGLTEKEDETPLSHWGYHHDVFQFVFCRRKVNVSQFVSFIFSSKEVSKLNLFEAARCFIHKFLEWTLKVLMNLSPSATEQMYPSKWNRKNLRLSWHLLESWI